MPDRTRHADADGQRADAAICVVLRGEIADLREELSGIAPEVFLARVAFHGVAGLLLHQAPKSQDWPAAIREGVREQAVARLAIEFRHREVLERVLALMEHRRVRPLLMKGTVFAYTLYDAPEHRPRDDSDMLVRPEEQEAAAAALREAGFRTAHELTGTGVANQAGHVLVDAAGFRHLVDLHWQMFNSAFLSGLFSHRELAARAVPLPGISAAARGLGPVDRMLHACVHRRLDPELADRLIWTYDIHLLARSFSTKDWELLVELTRAKGLSEICLGNLWLAQEKLATPCPEPVLRRLAEARGEPPVAYLRADPLRREFIDFKARPGIAAKLRYLRLTCFPSVAFMRREFPGAGPAQLPWLYARRAAGGLAKRFGVRRGNG